MEHCPLSHIVGCMVCHSPEYYLANKLLGKQINTHGYHESNIVPGLWKHEWRPVQCTPVVNNVGVKYIEEEHALHLKAALEENYILTTEWEDRRSIGIILETTSPGGSTCQC